MALSQQQQQQQQQSPCKTSSPPRRTNWWRKSIVQRTVSFVENDFEQVVEQSPFLQQAEPGDHIALFHRSEIITGEKLGKGGFSDVSEITGFELNEQLSARLTPEQRLLREHYQSLATEQPGRFVIKHLQERLLSNPKSFQCAASDLALEAAYMSALDHPNILKVRGLPVEGLSALSDGRHDGYFIILDRVQETLNMRIEKWREMGADASLQEKGDYAMQIAQALSHLHDQRILFRDLKPANIGIMKDGTIKLLDFGLVRELPSRPTSACSSMVDATLCEDVYEMSGVGTRRYMGPEIFNTGQYNDKADVYSWSMIVYEMLQLEKPYPLLSVDDHTRQVCHDGERPPLENLKKDAQLLRHLLYQSWCESIVDRLSMREAHAQLQRILRDYSSSCSSSRVILQHAPTSPVGVMEELFLSSISIPDLALPLCASEEDLEEEPAVLSPKLSFNNISINEEDVPPAISYRKQAA